MIKYFRWLLLPFSILYGLVIKVRNFLYNKSILKSNNLPVPVISIGNITVGGTGKTPLCITLARFLTKSEYRVGIISRGYKKQSKGQVVVSTGKGPEVYPGEAGDEPYLMAQKTESVVIANPNRYQAGLTAIEEYNCDVLLLDDGFQHRKLERDFDILLWDSGHNPRKEYYLPTGNLRDSIQSVNRADCLVFTRCNSFPEKQSKYFSKINSDLNQYISKTKLDKVFNYKTGKTLALEKLENSSIYAFCALGNSEQFIKTVKKLNPKQLDYKTFRDHHKYDQEDIDQLKTESKNYDYLVTTEKDKVNLPQNHSLKEQLLILSIKPSIDTELGSHILQTIRKLK